jgi:hypothetical protein
MLVSYTDRRVGSLFAISLRAVSFIFPCFPVSALKRSGQINDCRRTLMNQLTNLLTQQQAWFAERQRPTVAEYQRLLQAWHERRVSYEQTLLSRYLPSRWNRAPTGTTLTQMNMHGNADVARATVATVLADVVDAVDYIEAGHIVKLEPFREPPPLPPPSTDSTANAEAMRLNQEEESKLRGELRELDALLAKSEDERGRHWKKMNKQQSEYECLPASTRDAPKQRGFMPQSGPYVGVPALATESHEQRLYHATMAARNAQAKAVCAQAEAKKKAAAVKAAKRPVPTRPVPASIPPTELPRIQVLPASPAPFSTQEDHGFADASRESPSNDGGTDLDNKYSAAKVRERIYADGSVRPVTEPKRGKDGLFQRPAGRTRKGMNWDAVRGIWIPDPSFKGPPESKSTP